MKILKMSLKLARLTRLVRQNAVSQLEQRACICSNTNLQQEYGKEMGGSNQDSLKLVGTPDMPKYVEKKKIISRAMQLYLEKRNKEASVRNKHINEMKLGERHLANIMGVDVNDLGSDDVKRAINYILPSGLYSRYARPTMELPDDILVERKAASFSPSGRPDHYLYYTLKPNYFQMMHEMSLLLEDLRLEQSLLQQKDLPLHPTNPDDEKAKEEFDKMVRVGIVDYDKLKERFADEKLSVANEVKFFTLLNRILSQPLAYKRMAFFEQFPKPDQVTIESIEREKAVIDEAGDLVAHAEGSRKSIKAQVKVSANGKGEISINGKDILFFNDVAYRQTVLFPLKFLGVLGEYDIVATVTTAEQTGQCCEAAQAGALRLAISRAIVQFVSDEDYFRMEKAGLLTRDPRIKERKKPGQEKARKKFTWKAR